jgi:hypothetical protein
VNLILSQPLRRNGRFQVSTEAGVNPDATGEQAFPMMGDSPAQWRDGAHERNTPPSPCFSLATSG